MFPIQIYFNNLLYSDLAVIHSLDSECLEAYASLAIW